MINSRDQSVHGLEILSGKIQMMHGRMVYAVPLPQSFSHECGDCGSKATTLIVETQNTIRSEPRQPLAWAYCGQCDIGG